MRIGTRASPLALAQATWVAERIGGELVTLTTSGDTGGGPQDKSRWVDTIERALVAGEIDLAVHSAKDVPGELADGTEIVAVPPREDPRDLLIGTTPGRVGTSSLRRAAQLRAWRDDLDVVDLRGNVDTRLRKWRDGEVDALVLAAAGLRRLGRDEPGLLLEAAVFVPAAGQGALALQARADDAAVRAAVAPIADERALACLLAERDATRVLGASCHTPVGIHADGRTTRGFVGAPDGSAWVLDEVAGLDGEGLARRMLAAGAAELLG
ncbi:MAG: hydroxymethylbilane synthase [Solirubrobacteraceae bacterium]|nr:hydroxymethylbilane synthase [Solirubrobacteraceae bacterium]